MSWDNRVRFDRRSTLPDDGTGNTLGPWAPLLECWARIEARPGAEGGLIGMVTVGRSREASDVRASDRAVVIAGTFNGKILDLKSIIPSPDGRAIDMTWREVSP